MATEESRRLAAVCFAEIDGYARLADEDPDTARKITRDLQGLAKHHAASRGGRPANLKGETALAVFGNADSAVLAGLAVRDDFSSLSEARAGGLALRVGIHVGDVAETEQGDIYGDAVEVEEVGERTLKGVPDAVRLYAARLVGPEATVDVRSLLEEELAPLQLLDVEGIGGMGEIYLARDPGLRRTLAVKVLRTELLADDQARSRFQREAQVIAGLSHPNIVGVHTVGELRDGTPYFVMDYVAGGSLADRLEAEGPLPVSEVRKIVGEVASALSAAHARGVVHRDIKASNILMDSEAGRVLVTDWGIAALDPTVDLSPDDRLTRTGMVIGSPRYMSPEQLAGDDVGPESDLYSLGLLAFELLTGEGPFPDETPRALMIAHLREDAPPLSEVREGVDPELETMVARCLSKTPEGRPTAEDVAQRFAPGADAVLEWPPPGLEAIKGEGRVHLLGVLAIGAFMAVPILPALAARMDWAGQPLIQDLISGSFGAFFLMFVTVGFLVLVIGIAATVTGRTEVFMVSGVGDTKAFQSGQALKAAMDLRYGWRTVLETLHDRWGDHGNLIAGLREYSVLDAEGRARVRRRRLRRTLLRWAGAFTLPFSILLAGSLAAAGAVSAWWALLIALGPPALLWLLSLWPVETHEVRMARARLTHTAQTGEMVASQVEAWKETLDRVVGDATAVKPGRETSRRTYYAFQTVIFLVGFLPYLYVLSAMLTMAIGGTTARSPNFANVPARFERARSAAALRLPVDGDLDAEDAGELARTLARWDPDATPWRGDRPTDETVGGSSLIGTATPPPYRLSQAGVIPAALRGLTPAERAYLAGFTGDPRFGWFESLARAGAYDPLNAEAYPEDLLPGQRPTLPEPGALRRVGYHKLAQAGWLLDGGDEDGAETALREVFSVGLLLAEESNDLNAAVTGRNIATLALDALEQLYLGLGRDTDASLVSSSSERIPAPRQIEEATPRWRAWMERSLALARDTTTVRALRIEILGTLRTVSRCASLEGVVLGPPPEVEQAVAEARQALIRYPSDEAYMAMLFDAPDRIYQWVSGSSGEALKEALDEDDLIAYRPLHWTGLLVRNRSFSTCPAMVLAF